MKRKKRRKAMKTKPKTTRTWYNQRKTAVVLTLIALIAAYLVSLRAFDTGSLQQYAITLFLIIFAITEWVSAMRAKGVTK